MPADGTRLPTKCETTISAVVVLHGSSRTLSPQDAAITLGKHNK